MFPDCTHSESLSGLRVCPHADEVKYQPNAIVIYNMLTCRVLAFWGFGAQFPFPPSCCRDFRSEVGFCGHCQTGVPNLLKSRLGGSRWKPNDNLDLRSVREVGNEKWNEFRDSRKEKPPLGWCVYGSFHFSFPGSPASLHRGGPPPPKQKKTTCLATNTMARCRGKGV